MLEHGIPEPISKKVLLTADRVVDCAYRFVNRYSDGSLGYVEYYTSSAVIVLEGHALVDGGIHFDVYIVTSLSKLKSDIGEKNNNSVHGIDQLESNDMSEMEFRDFDRLIIRIHLEGAQISGRWATSISLKWLLEKRARMCAITERVWHF